MLIYYYILNICTCIHTEHYTTNTLGEGCTA